MTPDLRTAILLLMSADTIISKRKFMESACGYPDEYGGDEFLIQAIKKFLTLEEIAPRVAEYMEEFGDAPKRA